MANDVSIFTSEDRKLFENIAKDIRNNPKKYKQAGKWLDEYCAEGSYWRRLKDELEELRKKYREYSILSNLQSVQELESKIREKRTPSLKQRFHQAYDYWFEKCKDQESIPADDAKHIILITWLLTDPDIEKAPIGIMQLLEVWPWKPVDDILQDSRGVEQCLWRHNELSLRTWLAKVSIAWSQLQGSTPYYEKMWTWIKKGWVYIFGAAIFLAAILAILWYAIDLKGRFFPR